MCIEALKLNTEACFALTGSEASAWGDSMQEVSLASSIWKSMR